MITELATPNTIINLCNFFARLWIKWTINRLCFCVWHYGGRTYTWISYNKAHFQQQNPKGDIPNWSDALIKICTVTRSKDRRHKWFSEFSSWFTIDKPTDWLEAPTAQAFSLFLVLSLFSDFTTSGYLEAWRDRERVKAFLTFHDYPFQCDTEHLPATCISYRLTNDFLLCFWKQNKWICFHFLHY
jgi:hypothetical protein